MNGQISFAISANSPLEYENYQWQGNKYLLVYYEGCFTITNGPFLFLLVPDDNSAVVQQIKNRQVFGKFLITPFANLKLLKKKPLKTDYGQYWQQHLLIKDTSQVKIGSQQLTTSITFKVRSQKKTKSEFGSGDPSNYNHQLEIEPLLFGIEHLKPINRVIFEFWESAGDNSGPRSLKKSKLYNSNILSESAGKTFTMKIKNYGIKIGEDGKLGLTFWSDYGFDFEEDSIQVHNSPPNNSKFLKTVLIVGGVIIGLILVIGLFYYFRKQKSLLKK